MPLRGCWVRLRRCGTACGAKSGLSRPHDEPREGRRTLPWRTLSAPKDHHHQYLTAVLPGYGVATKSRPCVLVAFVAIQATQPLHPSGRALVSAVRVVIKGYESSACEYSARLGVSASTYPKCWL